jgi:hypothetical protein
MKLIVASATINEIAEGEGEGEGEEEQQQQ